MKLPTLPLVATLFAVLSHLSAASAPVAVPRLTHPGAGQTVYFVLTDRFANGNPANDRGGYPGGPDDHGFDPTRVSHYHGGDLAGLTARLDYLEKLGVTAIWFTPPLKNKPVQQGTAGYHGYWITDFLNIDPHLGTNEEFRELIRQAHARGMRVYMDIIVNHTADVIGYRSASYDYRDTATHPFRDASGQPFDARAVAYNGLVGREAFPALSPERSFAYQPFIPAGEETIKNPAWLNDLRYYHNRGNTTFSGENAVYGDFVGLDDVFTEHPEVVDGFIEIFSSWLDSGIDGFRIDTARHVNTAFWHAFNTAIRDRARALGRPDFIQFGEVYNDTPQAPAVLSEFSTGMPMDTTLDFGFFLAARRFVSQQGTAAELATFFRTDDLYTDHDSNIHATLTFLGNHDAGRFPYFLLQDNPDAPADQLAALTQFAHGLLYLSRGQPVLYYGDEQGMIGRGGNDMQARESLFASQAPAFRDATLLATNRTGADDKYDEHHPFYRLFSQLGALRRDHRALRTGAMLVRPTGKDEVFAFSRLDRDERVEYVAVFNRHRSAAASALVPTSQRPGTRLTPLFSSHGRSGAVTADAQGAITVELPPLSFALWRAETALPKTADAPAVRWNGLNPGTRLRFDTREVDGLIFPSRQELQVEVTGGDGVAEVTFAFERASRPGQIELIGVDDAAPYRVFWTPPADLQAGESFTFTATANDLRGHVASATVGGITLATGAPEFGIRGATTPIFTSHAGASRRVVPGSTFTLSVTVEGTGPFEFQWLRNDQVIEGATGSSLIVTAASPDDAGRYRVLVRNRAGTTVSPETVVTFEAPAAPARGRVVRHADFPSRQVAARHLDVWLPPGYDENASQRYPVLYLHDGQNLFDPTLSYGGEAWELDDAMERLIARGDVRPAILVGVWNSPLRAAEYFPQKAVSTDRIQAVPGLHPQPDARIQSDAYLRFLVEEVKPFIDRTYRTRPGRDDTFVMGSSMGGLISAYAMVEYPAVFGGAGCVSTHWPAGDGAVIDWLASKLPLDPGNRWYFDHGTVELDALYAPFQRRMDGVMRATGHVPGPRWQTRVFAGTDHSEVAWRERAEVPLTFLLGK